METIVMDGKIVESKILLDSYIRSMKLEKYYDYHGERIPEGVDNYEYNKPKRIVIIEEITQYDNPGGEPFKISSWRVKINNKTTLQELEITYFHVMGSSIVLEGCVGAG